MTMGLPGSEVACPLCEAASTEIYLDGDEEVLEPSAIGSSRRHIFPGKILRCRVCRFAFRQARSSPEDLRNLYRQMDAKVYESELRGRDRTAQKHFTIVNRYSRPGRILDVGCASGLFLKHALEAGWEVTGLEPSEVLCGVARKNLGGKGQIMCTTLEDSGLEQSFDAITLWDVLEHVSDPLGFLRFCRGLLKPDGLLFLNVPDLDSKEARLLGPRWPLFLPEHLNYFNRNSLRLCATRAALKPVRFGQRHAWFSLKYVAYRLAQHSIPGSFLLKKTGDSFLGGILIPVSLGETLAVLRAAGTTRD